MFNHSTKPRHGRVIDESGREVDDTQPMRLLSFVAGLAHRHAEDETQELPVSRLLHDGRSAATTVLPVHGARTIVMRRPVAPSEPPLSERFPRSFFEIPEFVQQLDEMSGRVHAETARMFREFGVQMNALLRRAREVSAAWRYSSVESDGEELAAAYAAAGTAEMPGLVSQVAEEIVRRAKAGASL